MDLESTSREYGASLSSIRANERKKSAESLKDLLTRNALPSLLSNNTLTKRGYSWNDLFADISEYVLKETEKFETSKTFPNVTGPLCSSLLHMCVAGANKGKAYIKCDKVLEACLFILKNNRLSKAIGDAYLNLLYKHILTCDHYLNFITPKHWEDLLNVCVSICLATDLKLDNFTQLRLLSLIIKNGSKYCQFTNPVRDILPRLKKCFIQLQNDTKVQEILIEIMILLLEMLSTECRYSMCEFTETITPLMLKYYDSFLEQKKKNSLFRVLELTVVLHHPGGKLRNEDGSLANNWDTWDRQLTNILEIVTLEINVLQKNRKQHEFSEHHNCQFSSLAAAVYYQNFHLSANSLNDSEAGNTTKRQKIAMNKYRAFSDLIYQLENNHIPWLAILHLYIKQHGDTISVTDYLSTIKVLDILVNSNNQNVDWELYKDVTSLVINHLSVSTTYKSDIHDAILSLWNSCVRNSTAINGANKHLHTLIQKMLNIKILNYQNVQPLIKLYLEKGMPVNDNTVMTLNATISKFFNKCSSKDQRTNFLNWFRNGVPSISVDNAKELIVRLVANDNVNIDEDRRTHDNDPLFDILFDSTDHSILFSNFEHELGPLGTVNEEAKEKSELNTEIDEHFKLYLECLLLQNTDKFKNKVIDLSQYLESAKIAITYLNVMLKFQFLSENDVRTLQLHALVKTCMTLIFESVVTTAKSNAPIPNKIKSLQHVKEMLIYDYEPLISTEIRQLVPEYFFHYVNNILTSENEVDDDIEYNGDENEMNSITLKYNCIYTLAAYCRVPANYREELLELILNPKLYDFSLVWDVRCAFQCIKILNEPGNKDPPLDSIFVFMQYLCKDLFRIPDATYELLTILYKMLDLLWTLDDEMKQNSFIMIRGYLDRSEKLFYPAKLVALIHKCASKVIVLNNGNIHDIDCFIKSIIKKSRGDNHCLRIYCSYLLKTVINFNSFEVETYLSGISDIFVIDISESIPILLKDELANRTLSMLHSLVVIASEKKELIQIVINLILKQQQEKPLNKKVVKKVFNIITNKVCNKPIAEYFNRNILCILHFWFAEKYELKDLPIMFFDVKNQAEFIEKHLKWLISADILWRCGGNINDSSILKQAKTKLMMSESKIIEICFCNIIVLCLPYIVTDKYKLRYMDSGDICKRSTMNANRMYQMTRQILENEKWSNLFVENVGELLLLTATHLCDKDEAKELFQVDITTQTDSYLYPKNVFMGILKYFGKIIKDMAVLFEKAEAQKKFVYPQELTDGDIMQYLCENQPVAIFKILLKLWENVLQENVNELKVLAVHAFKTFVECIPLISPSDVFVCNYVCNCFSFAIKKSKSNEEIRILTEGLRSILVFFLPGKVGILQKALSQLLSTLTIKKDEGFEKECAALLRYLVVDMRDYLKGGEDVVDFIKSMSTQCATKNTYCTSYDEFSERLNTYKLALNSPSNESLISFKQFLKINKQYTTIAWKNLDSVRFSEDCDESSIHQIIHQLNQIMENVTDPKTIIEACNCLSEIGTYDLKTLVTLPSVDLAIGPGQPRCAVAAAVISTLSDNLFDENPTVTNKIANALNRLFKFKEAVDALGKAYVQQWTNMADDDGDNFNEHGLIFLQGCLLLESYGKEILLICKNSLTDKNIFLASQEPHKNILKPFISEQSVEYAVFKVDAGKFNAYADLIFFEPVDSENHKSWLTKHTIAVLDILGSETNYFHTLSEVCRLKPSVCQRILPALMSLLLYYGSEKNIQIIADQINHFFNYIWDLSFNDKIENSIDISNDAKTNSLDQNHKLIIQYVLEVVNYVRLQKKYYKHRSSGQNRRESLNYLNLDYEKVAWAAAVADQNLSAIYYGELWVAAMNDGVPPSSPDATTAIPGGKDLQRIFRKSFVSIAEMDAIDGCGTAHLTIEDEKRKHLINTGQFLDALLIHDIALSSSRADLELQHGVVRSLHKSGMHHLALQYIKSLPENDKLNDVKYECLSSLGDWSDFVDTKAIEEKCSDLNSNTQSILKAYRYACLKDCLNVQIKPELEDKLVQPINRAKIAISKLCQELNMDNCQNVYKILSKLHLFTDIEDYFDVRCDKLPLSELLNNWRVENLPTYQDFKHLEDLILQRNIMLEYSAKSFSHYLKDITSLQLEYAELSLKNDRIQMSQRLLAVVKKLQTSDEVTLLESQISWAKGHKDIALSLLHNIVSSINDQSDLKQTAASLRLYGLWMAESKSDNTRNIINNYLKKSLEVTNDDNKTRQKVYFDIAKFADAEYKQVVAYMNSSIFQNKVKCVENMKDTASSLRSTQQSLLTKDERKVLFTNERFKDLEETDIISTRTEKQTLLQLAMRYYLLSLKECEENNLSVFRVISLWLENPNMNMGGDSVPFEVMLHDIPSRKFVAVLPQLAPRLTDENNAFADNLRKILKRCAIDHPHHTLPILFSLKNSDKDKYILNASQAVSGRPSRSTAQEPRVVAADALVRQIADENAVLAVIVAQMEQLCDATISFANYKPKGREQKQKIPSAEGIQKLRHLDAIPIPTVNVPIRNDCHYGNLNTLVAFDNYFELVGGINFPKKINCTNSNGTRNIILIKGEDDLRQDAVMQQVFSIVNTLLEKNSITNKNKLIIRTYKVVPMSRQSGVLEWCVGTTPIGLYLVGTANEPGAHARYRPMDISCSVAREMLNRCYQQRKSNREKLAAFNSVLKQFKPVFHYFFTEHYLDPVTWYERRLAYTKSVATSSMVGYILGLGDRHLQNILIDKKTAEVVHIDFGIAFDSGKALPTPETIPFRLTQDIVAGFGCSGVEGIFRRCCEKTMQLLRDNQGTLLTILEVLLCDPLYSWTLRQDKTAASTQAPNTTLCAGGSNSSLAERALLAVGSKLTGTEGGVAGGVAVPGQVARLISTATDRGNLARLFPGWQPYL